jgi:hypothetical protein
MGYGSKMNSTCSAPPLAPIARACSSVSSTSEASSANMTSAWGRHSRVSNVLHGTGCYQLNVF